jgi:hypothetical protein
MFKKVNITVLLIVLIALLGVYLVIKYTGSDDRTFRSIVLEFDPEAITEMHVNDYPEGKELKIILDEGTWRIHHGDAVLLADPDLMRNTLAMLSRMNTESVAATGKGQWEEYKVDQQQAIRVILYEGEKEAGDLYIGKFDFKQLPASAPGRQPETTMTSYVRPADEKKVYAVRGLLRSNFQGGAKTFRNRILFDTDKHTNISKVSLSGPESSFVLQQGPAGWTIDGLPADSARTDRYLRLLARLRNSNFMEDMNLENTHPAYTLQIEGNNFAPASLNAYPTDSASMYYITSSINPGTVFDGTKAKLFEKVFIGTDELLPGE